MTKVDDKRQTRSKKGGKQWLKWLCNPNVLKVLLQFGMVIYELLKFLREIFGR